MFYLVKQFLARLGHLPLYRPHFLQYVSHWLKKYLHR
jgi:hypothetical protein